MAHPEPVEPAFARFTGQGWEYFRIWSVNLVLTIITLGVYSAWAKVRRTQYFYRHTHLAGSSFDYRGQPVAILKGRLVALGLFALYSAIGYVNWPLAIGILVVLAAALPWLLGQSMRFRLANTRWRGLAFGFQGTTLDAYRVFLAWPLLTLVSLGTLFPLWRQRLARYQFGRATFGDQDADCQVGAGRFYAVYVQNTVLFFILIAVAAVLATLTGVSISPAAGVMVMLLLYALTFVTMAAMLSARLQEETWQATRIGPHRVRLRLNGPALGLLHLSNLALTILTVGFFRPFAQVRVAAYYASCLELAPAAPLDEVRGRVMAESGAAGDATTDIFDLDLAL